MWRLETKMECEKEGQMTYSTFFSKGDKEDIEAHTEFLDSERETQRS